MTAQELKQRAADAAVNYVRDGMTLGLGSGSTAECYIRALGAALQSARVKNVRAVASSVASEKLAGQLGIPMTTLAQARTLDLTVDGADEITPELDLIKGLGGALLREKIVAQASRLFIIIADESKTVQILGTRSPLPVEVVPFEHSLHVDFFRSLGCQPVLRTDKDGKIYVTDNGNYIYDCRFSSIPNPRELESRLKSRAGVVETGLFVGNATHALIASDNGVREMRSTRSPQPAL